MKILISQEVKEYLESNNYNRICMTRGKDRCISIFSEDEWNRQKNELKSMFPQKRKREQMLEMFFQNPVGIDLENNGYTVMNVPDELQKWAGIEGDIIIVAKSNKVEIWSKENYNSYSKDKSGVVIESSNYKGE